MRFSIWPAMHHPWDETLDFVRHCEAAGWDGVWFADHFMPNTGPDGPPADGATLECWAVLAALAASTERLRLGSLVCGNTYRHPTVLANIAASVDRVSNGRLVLGLGAGWQVNEHRAYGIDLPSPKGRLDRLEEAAQVVLGLLREQRTTFAGPHYQITDAPCDPKPVQERLPLLIGGRGERRTMRIAARFADEWNTWTTPAELAHKRQVLEGHCEQLGRDPADIAISTQAFMFLSDDARWAASKQTPAPGLPTLRGNTDQVAEVVAAYQDVGVDELIIPNWTIESLQERNDTFDRFITEIAPAFR